MTTAELSYLQDRRKAYENLAERTGLDGVKGVVTSLIQSEKYGTALSQSLRVQAQENRDMRMNEAEKKAAALPPKLTVPMIIFFLPVLFAVILTPAIIQMMKRLASEPAAAHVRLNPVTVSNSSRLRHDRGEARRCGQRDRRLIDQYVQLVCHCRTDKRAASCRLVGSGENGSRGLGA